MTLFGPGLNAGPRNPVELGARDPYALPPFHPTAQLRSVGGTGRRPRCLSAVRSWRPNQV